MAVQPGFCRNWSKTPKTGFRTMRLKYIKEDGAGYRLFETRGRFKEARKNFNAVKPTNKSKFEARSYNFNATGIVRDRRIQIRQNLKDVGYDKFPNVNQQSR